MICLSKTSEQEIKNFLWEFKYLIRNGDFYVIPRDENNRGLIALGITVKSQKKRLLELGKLDYSSGPTRDIDHSSEVWIFGIAINTTEVYIKLKIVYRHTGNKAKCLSFHPAEEPLSYPLKPEKTKPDT